MKRSGGVEAVLMGIPAGVCLCGSSRSATVLFLAVLVEVRLHHQGLVSVNFPASSSVLSFWLSPLALCPHALALFLQTLFPSLNLLLMLIFLGFNPMTRIFENHPP